MGTRLRPDLAARQEVNFSAEAIVSLIATLVSLVVFLLMLEESLALTTGRDPVTNDVRSAVRRFPRSEIGRYGVVVTRASKGRTHEVTDMVEKPEPGTEPSDLAILGRYILTPAAFGELDRAEPGAGKEIQLTDAIRDTIDSSGVSALEYTGDHYDLGTVPGFLKANLALGLRHPEMREELLSLVRELAGERALKE